MTTYVESSLGGDEEVLMMARFPWPYHALAWGSLIVLGIVGIGILIWLLMIVHFKTTEAALTTRRVVYKKGLFTRQTLELGLTTIEQVELIQGLWGRIFGFGVIEVSGTGEGRIRTHPMAHPITFRRMVTDARAKSREVHIAPEDRAALSAAG